MPRMIRRVPSAARRRNAARRGAKRAAFRAFLAGEKLGVHVLPTSYYSPVARRNELSKTREAWAKPAVMAIPAWNLDEQVAWSAKVCDGYAPETASAEFSRIEQDALGPGFGWFEARFLYCFIRCIRPRRVVEIGSGFSTSIMAHAATVNGPEAPTRIVSVDPHSPLRSTSAPGFTLEIRRESAQVADASLFTELQAGDLLFIDSSHSMKCGSEISRLYLEVLPRLSPQVVVHVHDIFLPYLYSPNVLRWIWDWQESALVAALLTESSAFRVLACQSALHHDRPAALADIIAGYRPRRVEAGLFVDDDTDAHFAASLWLERQARDA